MLADLHERWPAELRADFQQYYGLNLDGMGTEYTHLHAADLAATLPPESRVGRKAHPENEWSTSEYMLAGIEYNLAFLAWTKTKDAERDRNRPKPRQTPAEAAAIRAKVEKTDLAEIAEILGY